MSWNPTHNPDGPDPSGDPLETLIIPRARDLGGFEVRRALPSPQRQMVGPFIFFDQVGPAEFVTDGGTLNPNSKVIETVIIHVDLSIIFHHKTSRNFGIWNGEVNFLFSLFSDSHRCNDCVVFSA